MSSRDSSLPFPDSTLDVDERAAKKQRAENPDETCVGRNEEESNKQARRNDGTTGASVEYSDPTSVGNMKNQLAADRQCFIDLFNDAGMRGHSALSKLWGNLSNVWKRDRELAAAALCSKSVRPTELPTELTNDVEFWMSLVRRSSRFWEDLPENLGKDLDFAWKAPFRPENCDWYDDLHPPQIGKLVFERIPSLRDDREMWTKIIDASSKEHSAMHASDGHLLHELIREIAPIEIKHDRDLMLLACKRNGAIISLLKRPLRLDRDIVEAALTSGVQVRHETQRMHIDLVCKYLKRYMSRYATSDYGYIRKGTLAKDLWEDRRVVKAYFLAGGSLNESPIDIEKYKEDREIFLAIAWHGATATFQNHAPAALKGDKEFMSQVVERRGTFLRYALPSLQHDRDLLLLAVADSQEFARSRFIVNNRRVCKAARELAAGIHEKLKQHGIFIRTVLCGMTKDERCSLRLLNQGTEATTYLKKCLADYLGIPCGKQLRLYRRAAKNLPSLEVLNNQDGST